MFNLEICGDAPTRKRGRLRQACNSCSRVKKKCDGGNPCSFCEKGNLVCVYEERIRPGPPPKKSLSARSDNHPSDGAPSSSRAVATKPTVDCPITTDELNFITIFMQNVQGNIPLVTQQIINDGISKIAFTNPRNQSNNDSFGNNAIDTDAMISLTWSACCFGAFLAQDHRAENYLFNAHKSLQKCFDGATIMVAKASFALELLLQLFAESLSTFHLLSRRGVYFGLGETILFLSTMIKDADCEIIWNFLRLWKVPSNLIGGSLSEFWNIRFPGISMQANDSPLKHSHVMLQYWTSRLSEENYQETGKATVSTENSNTLRDIMIESHINGILQDIRQIKILEDNCLTQETNPATTVILHFSLSMHRLKLHQFEKAFHGLKSVAAYFWMHPFIISTPQMWKVVYITRMVLLNSELTYVPMQSSLRPLADDLFALLCHTGKLFGFNDVYSSNNSPILSNLRKNVMTIMFSTSHHVAETVAAYALAGSNIGSSTVTVLTMNGWLRLAQGEVSQAGNTIQQSDFTSREQIPPTVQPKTSRLSSMAVPSSFIDKRTCLPEKPISSIVENRIAAVTQGGGARGSHRPTELSRDALIALERTSNDGRTTSDCTSSWDTSTGDENDEYDDGKAGSSYNGAGKRRSRGTSRSSSTMKKTIPESNAGGSRGGGSQGGGSRGGGSNRGGSSVGRSSNEGSVKSSRTLSYTGPTQPISQHERFSQQPITYQTNINNSNGMDELLMQMMNTDYSVNYSFGNQSSEDNQVKVLVSNENRHGTRLSDKAVPNDYLDQQLNQSLQQENNQELPRNVSELSISAVMENLDTWMADLDANNMPYT